MVIEKFLALSMIALGLTASATQFQHAEEGRQNAARGRRRVRWLRQHMQKRTSAAGSAGERRHGFECGD